MFFPNFGFVLILSFFCGLYAKALEMTNSCARTADCLDMADQHIAICAALPSTTDTTANPVLTSRCAVNLLNTHKLLQAALAERRKFTSSCVREIEPNTGLDDLSGRDVRDCNAAFNQSSNIMKSIPKTDADACEESLEKLKEQCNAIAECCEDYEICTDYKYELSPLHDRIYQLKFDLYNGQKQCQTDDTMTEEDTLAVDALDYYSDHQVLDEY